jgi:hypothetical protein
MTPARRGNVAGRRLGPGPIAETSRAWTQFALGCRRLRLFVAYIGNGEKVQRDLYVYGSAGG